MVIEMKLILTVLFALFPYLHHQRYPITLENCETEHIVVKDKGDPFEITLFNLKTDEAGWKKTCSLLKDAARIEMEIDPSTQISEPLPAYLFIDGELLQKRLIQENHAYTLIHNPEYLYEKELLDIEESESVMAITENEPYTQDMRTQGRLFFLFILLSWGIMSVYSAMRIYHKNRHLPFTKS